MACDDVIVCSSSLLWYMCVTSLIDDFILLMPFTGKPVSLCHNDIKCTSSLDTFLGSAMVSLLAYSHFQLLLLEMIISVETP